MTRRTQEDWRKLIQQQADSPLTVADFCQQQALCQSNFYKRKSDLNNRTDQPQPTRFISVSKPKISSPQSTPIKLLHHQSQLSLPADISPVWLGELIKALV